MANQLLDAIQDGIKAGKNLVWLDAEDYGAAVVRNGKPFPWTNPTEFVSSYGQSQSLLKPAVAPVNLGSFFQAWLTENSAVLNEMSGKKRVRFAIKRFLGQEGHRGVIREIVAALCESVSQPVVLVLPTNGELINWANQAANGVGPANLTEIDIDSVSVYLADFLRTFAGLKVAGVLVQLPRGSAVGPDLLELYSPIVNVAKHYHWCFGVQVADPVSLEDPDGQIDLVLSNHADAQGQPLDDAFWQHGEHTAGRTGLWFSQLDATLAPELVLDRLQSLRG